MAILILGLLAVSVFLIIRFYLRIQTIGCYHDRFVLITGCDTGFGNLLAKKLDSMGMHVFAGCLTQKGQENLKMATSERLVAIPLDVTDGVSIQRAYEEVKGKLPKGKGLWGIVNNAGIGGNPLPIEWIKIEEYQKCCDVNLYGMIQVTTQFLPLVRKAKGRVVNMTSAAGKLAVVNIVYSVAKFAVEGFSDGLRYQMYKSGVSVHIIEPGFFWTPLVEKGFSSVGADTYHALDQERKEFYGQQYLNQLTSKNKRVIQAVVSPHLYKVVDAYTHALTAVYPKARYVVGYDANIIYRTLWNLPEWLCTWIVTRFIPTPAGCSK